MVDWLTLAVPFVYLAILVGSLATFSSLYRSRKTARAASLAPWFGPHLQRDIYLSLLHYEPEEGGMKIPESIIKAALLRRAAEDINRIISIRNSKQALSTLLQRGNVGDDLWQRFQRAEKEIEEELRDVVNEANAFSANWGQTIFQSASEMISNSTLRGKVAEVQSGVKSERQWWEKRKANIQSEFMKELDTDSAAKPTSPMPQSRASDDDGVLVEAGGPAVTQQGGGKKKKKGKN